MYMRAAGMLRDMKSIVMSTAVQNTPHSRIVDLMYYDETGLYFITSKSKPFYHQLKAARKIAMTGMTPSYVQVRVEGDVQEVEGESLDRAFSENPELGDLFPDRSKLEKMTLFHVFKGKGEIFDLSGAEVKMKRERFAFGGETVNPAGVTITDQCIACGACEKACPFGAIQAGEPYTVNRSFCDECGICITVCPVEAIELPKGL